VRIILSVKKTILARDMRAYYDIIKLLNELHERRVNPRLLERIESEVVIEVDSKQGSGLDDPFMAYFTMVLLVKGKRSFEKLVVGIDPGEKIGVAVVADGELLDLRIFRKRDMLEEYLDKVMAYCPARRKIVKVGSHVDDEMLSSLRRLKRRGVELKIVDESKSNTSAILSQMYPHIRADDMTSALRIAFRLTI